MLMMDSVPGKLIAVEGLDRSGMDIGLSRDWFESFIKYQHRLRTGFVKLQKHYGFESINTNRTVKATRNDLRGRLEMVLDRAYTGA